MNASRPLSVFKKTSRASKLLALVPPINALSDVEGQSSSDEEPDLHNGQEIDDISSDAPSIPSSLENLNIFDSNNGSDDSSNDEIPNSEPEVEEELPVPLTPIILKARQNEFCEAKVFYN
ncbi:uncharacterized protein LOC123701155 [Colias croceus]|uniref:uncharacterized protein LOC123701155 n=1 Tax=Colias crocea TaxID=72248 RepID=UPI001E27B741|nr:uncharacterized protein LOC123701155 [Colias croceus]